MTYAVNHENVDNRISLRLKGHGTYRADVHGFDHAMAYFANATDNDIMWNLIAHSGYEGDYSDVDSRYGLLVVWCDTHGLQWDETDKDWHDYIKRQYFVSDSRTPEWWATETRRAQEWMAEVYMTHDYSDLNSLKQDENGRLHIECDGWHLTHDFTGQERGNRTIQLQPTWVYPDGSETVVEGMYLAFCSDFDNQGGCGSMYEIPANRVRG